MTDAEESIGRARQDAQTGSEKGNISPTDCALSVQGNVWYLFENDQCPLVTG